jgi:hypothetical protein
VPLIVGALNMRLSAVFLAALITAVAVTSVDARRRHRHYHRGSVFVVPQTVPEAPLLGQGVLPDAARERIHRARVNLLPHDWELEPPDPNWRGKRFMSRDRTAWFASYSASVADESIAGHMKILAFADEEVITFLQGERNWIAVSGLKGNRIFYRKAIIRVLAKLGTTSLLNIRPIKNRGWSRL